MSNDDLTKGEDLVRKKSGATFLCVNFFCVCPRNIVISKKRSSFSINVQNPHFRPKIVVISKKKVRGHRHGAIVKK